MIKSLRNKTGEREVLTARDKAIEILIKTIDGVGVGYTEGEVYAAMTKREREEVENHIKELRKSCKERCLKSRARKKDK